jgi:Long-chain acyl-CoA synthetases (AMP-forming)
MARTKDSFTPWDFLDEFRGKDFNGEWPTIPEMFDITAKRYPDNMCFRVFVPREFSLTYTEAKEKIDAISHYLIQDGVKPGDKIAVSGKNSPEWACAYLAVLKAGAIIVPLDIAYNDDDMLKLLTFGDVSRIFIDADRIERLDPENTLSLKRYSLEEGSDYPYIFDLKGEKCEPVKKATEDDVAAIMFTSGTTGTPKGVMLTHKNLVSDCYQAQSNMNIYSTDVFYAILPIHHAYTMLAVFIEGISTGAGIVFGKRLVVSQLLKELKQGQVTMFLAVPMLFNKIISSLMAGVRKKGVVVYGIIRFLMGLSGFVKKVFGVNIGKKLFGFLLRQVSLETNRICISGGGPLPPSTFKQFNQLGIDFVQGYGLTETSPITHLNPIYAYEESSVGKNIAGVEAKIVDPDENGNGLIFLRGSMVMKGYYKNEEATKEVIGDDGFINTGDIGHIDSRGYLYLTGRAKNIIVTEGGKNVFPEEIEDHFQLYTEIDQICIVGYHAKENNMGESIRAIIHPAGAYAKSVSPEELKARIEEIISAVNKELHPYQKITKITIADKELPMTSTKKIKRFEVVKLFKD